MTKTKKTKMLLFLSGVLLLTSAGVANADDNRQVWRDTEGAIVHNSWGTCVRGNWDVDHDPCAESQIVEITQQEPPPPQPRTVIAQEDRTLYFDFNKSVLTPEDIQKLNSLDQKINSADDIQAAQVVGYADRIGTASYNQKLSEKRAEAVRSYMIAHGLLKPSSTETRWVGKSQPSAECPASLPREQMIQCLQPDRKVTVEIQYRWQKLGN